MEATDGNKGLKDANEAKLESAKANECHTAGLPHACIEQSNDIAEEDPTGDCYLDAVNEGLQYILFAPTPFKLPHSDIRQRLNWRWKVPLEARYQEARFRARKLRRNAQTSQLSDPESIGDATPYTASQVKDDSFWAQSRSAQLVAMSMVKHHVDQGEMVRSKARITGLGARGHRFYESLLFVRIAAPVETPVESTTTPQTEMTVFLSRRAVEDILGIRYSGMIYMSSVYLRDMLRALEKKLPMMSVVELTFLGSKIDLPIVRRLKTELDPSIPHYLSKSLWSSHHDDSNDDDIKEEGGEEEEAQLFALTETLRRMLEPEL
ncbi:hypothetical protein DFQ26_008550 [Actinomortierella ambigua]|nr:hypothetical protein DFQ26_008550 [Actinomortierella ambigua]